MDLSGQNPVIDSRTGPVSFVRESRSLGSSVDVGTSGCRLGNPRRLSNGYCSALHTHQGRAGVLSSPILFSPPSTGFSDTIKSFPDSKFSHVPKPMVLHPGSWQARGVAEPVQSEVKAFGLIERTPRGSVEFRRTPITVESLQRSRSRSACRRGFGVDGPTLRDSDGRPRGRRLVR